MASVKALTEKEFQDIPKEQWVEKTLKDLKGKPLESIYWNHPELGAIPPVFHPGEDIRSHTLPPRSYQGENGDWQIRQAFGPEDGNALVIKSLMQGSQALCFEGVDKNSLAELIKGVHLNMVHIHVPVSESMNAKDILEVLKGMVDNVSELRGSFDFDPISDSVDQGTSLDSMSSQVAQHLEQAMEAPHMKCVTVNAHRYFEAGMSDVQELAVALLIGKRYIDHMMNAGLSIDDASARIEFSLSASNSYFMQIAKFRAMRILWAKIISSYNPESDCSVVTWINAKGSTRYYDYRDIHNNLLRATTAAMAAASGGADSIELPPITPWAKNEDMLRWSRNIQHLLKEESWHNAVIDPANGSYYIEYLTSQLHDTAVELFEDWDGKDVFSSDEASQGLLDLVKKGAEQVRNAIRTNELTVVGVNKFVKEGVEKPNIASENGNLAPLMVALEDLGHE